MEAGQGTVQFWRGEPLDDGHRTSALGTAPKRRSRSRLDSRRSGYWSGCRLRSQQLPAQWQQAPTTTVGQEAEEANADKAAWQYVQKEPPHELLGGQRQQPLLAAMRVVFPTEGDLAVGKAHQPVIGNRHPMRVASQVVQHVFWSAKGWLGVNDPTLAMQRAEEGAKGLLLPEGLQLAGQAEPPRFPGALQSIDEFAAKDGAEHQHRQEEVVAGTDPTLMVG